MFGPRGSVTAEDGDSINDGNTTGDDFVVGTVSDSPTLLVRDRNGAGTVGGYATGWHATAANGPLLTILAKLVASDDVREAAAAALGFSCGAGEACRRAASVIHPFSHVSLCCAPCALRISAAHRLAHAFWHSKVPGDGGYACTQCGYVRGHGSHDWTMRRFKECGHTVHVSKSGTGVPCVPSSSPLRTCIVESSDGSCPLCSWTTVADSRGKKTVAAGRVGGDSKVGQDSAVRVLAFTQLLDLRISVLGLVPLLRVTPDQTDQLRGAWQRAAPDSISLLATKNEVELSNEVTTQIELFVGSDAWDVAVRDVIHKLEQHALAIAVELRKQRALNAEDHSSDDEDECEPYRSTDVAHFSRSETDLDAAAATAVDAVAAGRRTTAQTDALKSPCRVNRYALLPPVHALGSMQRSVQSLPTQGQRLAAAVWRSIVLVVLGTENADNVEALCAAAPHAKQRGTKRGGRKRRAPAEVAPFLAALEHLVQLKAPLPVPVGGAVPRRFATKTTAALLGCVGPLTSGTAPSYTPGLSSICDGLVSGNTVAHGREAVHLFNQNLKSIGWWMSWKIVGTLVGMLDETLNSEMLFRVTSRMEPVQGAKSRVWSTATGLATDPATGQVDCEDYMAPHLAQLVACCLRDGSFINQRVFKNDCGVYARGRALFVLVENSMCELSREVKKAGAEDAVESKERGNSTSGEKVKKPTSKGGTRGATSKQKKASPGNRQRGGRGGGRKGGTGGRGGRSTSTSRPPQNKGGKGPYR